MLLQKSPKDYNYPLHWSFCSGFVKEFESGEDTCLREIKEEIGLKAKIIKTGKVIIVVDKKKKKRWIVAVYLCSVANNKVKLCHENIAFRWVKKNEFKNYNFVPGLTKDLKSLGIL